MSENGQSRMTAPPSMRHLQPTMNLIDDDAAYSAMKSRDPRFDGVFFVGVTSTGIYFLPICPVQVPKRENCPFFANAGSPDTAAFRPFLPAPSPSITSNVVRTDLSHPALLLGPGA